MATIFGGSLPALAADSLYVNSGSSYKQNLRRYDQEVKSLGALPAIVLTDNAEKIGHAKSTRQMPPMPKKTVQYKHLLSGNRLKELTIFEDDTMVVKRPSLAALISVQQEMNPLSMDARYFQGVTLKDLLVFGLTHNLDIRIARNDAKAAKYTYLGTLGKFLPDISIGDNQLWARGKLGLPLGTADAVNLTGPFMIAHAGFTHHVYQGGKVVFGALQNRHIKNASNASFHAGYSDTLTAIAKQYYDLVQQETVLQIRVRAADTSEEQVRVATERFENGSGTNLDVLQARTQLSTDRQNLLEQQVTRRQAAIDLAALLNHDMDFDLQPSESIDRAPLIPQSTKIDRLLKVAVDNRAELKQLSELIKAAKSEVKVVAAGLHPSIDLGGNIYGIGRDPGSVDAIYVLSLNMQWKLGGLGTVDAANIAAARARARNTSIKLQKKLIEVCQDVRKSFIKCRAADQNITESDNRVASALEELRLAEIRFQSGVGTHLDVLTAQRDYTEAQIAKAEAITSFNISQIQLIRELGLVSVDNLSAKQPIL